MADVDGNNEVNITDATYIQLYIAKYEKHAKVGEPYAVPRPTQPTTANPTEPATTGKSLTVTAKSNIFPQATTKFDPIANQITVTYWINIKEYPMVNAQWALSYDKNYLTVDMSDGVNFKTGKNNKKVPAVFPATDDGNSPVINFEPESMPNGGILGNASDLSGYDLTTEDGGRVPFVTVTFNPVEGAEGSTTVNLDVIVMQLGDDQGKQFYFINDSKIVRPDINYLPSDTATAVYAGTFDNSKQQTPDVTTPQPTEAPTTAAPYPGSLSVKATSNIFPQATTTFDPVANQITVTYWINIKDATMINGQWTMSYDKKYLTFDNTDGVNRNGKKYLIFRATNGESTVNNIDVDTMPGGGIKCNGADLDGFDLSGETGGRVPFVSVTFNPVRGMTGETTVNLDVEYLQLKDDSNPQYYFINDSKIVRSDISYLPSDTATAVYAGTFDNTKQQKPDDVQPTTAAPTTQAPTTQAPTQAPTTQAPTTQAPTTQAPTTAPTTQAPTTAPTTEPPTEPPTDPVPDDFTVKFTNNLGWSSVYVHYWTDGASSSEWPGIQMTDIGENGYDPGVHNYSATIPEGAAGIVFTAGENGPQTTDVTDFSAEGWFVNSSYTTEKDGKTLYNALPWGTDISGGGGSDTYTVKFSCNWGGTMRAYYWAEGNTPVEWNSAPTMNVEQQDNGFGQSVYVIDIPSIYNMVIFQNGSKQTVDINTNSQNTNYFDKGESNGKYNVGTW